ncbi:MAG TPA: N-acetylmuramoyl-L-alanine amidase [Mycobacterium sp.]|nr:N-acetylmuramoyl-L-alanine amidase [Mycobacterium sp.]
MSLRRSAPTVLLTATLATVVMLPWAIDSALDEPPPDAAATRLNQQPLPGLGAGVSVREVTQAEPFSMVALTGADLTGTSARVRARHADGSWGPWYQTRYEAEHGTAALGPGAPRAAAPANGTDPVFVGNTTTVQIAVTRPADAPVTPTPKDGRKPAHQPASDAPGYQLATAERPLGQGVSAVLISPPEGPANLRFKPPAGITAPGQPPQIIPREHWGGPEQNRCGEPTDFRVRAAVIHHTAGSNDYGPEDSARIVRAIYAYHTRTLGWCDIGYNALVDKYGQVFEGRAGGITKGIRGTHAGGFNYGTWGVSMIGTFDDSPPPDIQLHTVGRLVGWRLGLDRTDPLGTVELTSAGGSYTSFRRGTKLQMPVIMGHRDVDTTECPGDAGHAALAEIRAIAARFNAPQGPEELARSMQGTAIHRRWERLGAMNSPLGWPTSPEAGGADLARYVTFEHGAVYWSPKTGAQPVRGAIYDAWASLGYERGALGLPTSGEINEPEWVEQYFQHGTLNINRASGVVTRVVDGVAQLLPPAAPEGPPMQLERFSPIGILAAEGS